MTGTPARVLVIDDEPLMRKLLARLLQRQGHDVVVAGDGSPEETRALIASGQHDLIVTDLHMPEPDGLAVLKLTRETNPDMPVILITAAPSTHTAIEAVNLRATAYLTKPIESDRLEAEVQAALALTRLSHVRREAHSLLGQEVSRPPTVLETQFDQGLAGLHMVFQPIVSWRSQSAYGYEALVRTKDPGFPHPGALFSAAARLGRSQDVGRSIRARTTEQSLPAGTLLFLNLNADDLLDEQLFGTSALSSMAHRVVLEVTERAQLEGIPDVGQRISALRDMGFHIAVDDIGAGYSGLSSFALLKPDIVKLDISLVRSIQHDAVKQRLAGLVIELCKDLGIRVVGEGVEHPEERDALLELGCDLFQGYLFGRPGPPFPVPIW